MFISTAEGTTASNLDVILSEHPLEKIRNTLSSQLDVMFQNKDSRFQFWKSSDGSLHEVTQLPLLHLIRIAAWLNGDGITPCKASYPKRKKWLDVMLQELIRRRSHNLTHRRVSRHTMDLCYRKCPANMLSINALEFLDKHNLIAGLII